MSVYNLAQGVEFILVRHAESESNQEIHQGKQTLSLFQDAKLTNVGKKQARTTGKYIQCNLPAYRVLGIWTSPQERAKDTAKELNGDGGFAPEIETICELYEYRTTEKEDLLVFDGVLHTDKSWSMFMERVAAFKKRCQSYTEKNLDASTDHVRPVVLVFGHSLFFSAFLSICIGCTPKSAGDIAFHLPNASLTSLFYNPKINKWSILQVGALHHLDESLRIKHSAL